MRVLVTGGAGYIGAVVVEELLAAGAERVVVLDDLSTGHAAAVMPPATLHRGDIADAKQVERLCGSEGIDAVIHLAAASIVGESMRDPSRYYRDNVTKGLALLDAVIAAGVRRFVFSSSAAVYGAPAADPITEETPTAPNNTYGETKLAFERALEWYGHAHGLRHASLRYFNAAGATARSGERHDPETHLIPIALDVAARVRSSLTIHGSDYPTRDGTCVRDYVHVSDLARAHLLLLDAIEQGCSRFYNLGSGVGSTVAEVVEAVRTVTGRDVPTVSGPRRPGDPPRLVASSERIQRDLAWSPRKPDLQQIVADAWAWRQSHAHGRR
jgi:UDP-glucose 4-epimerase